MCCVRQIPQCPGSRNSPSGETEQNSFSSSTPGRWQPTETWKHWETPSLHYQTGDPSTERQTGAGCLAFSWIRLNKTDISWSVEITWSVSPALRTPELFDILAILFAEGTLISTSTIPQSLLFVLLTILSVIKCILCVADSDLCCVHKNRTYSSQRDTQTVRETGTL